MKMYASSLRYVVHESLFAVEGALTNQLNTITDEIVLKNRDADGVEASTFDPLMISAVIGPTTVRKVLFDCVKKL